VRADDAEGGVGTLVEFGEAGVVVPDFFQVVREECFSCTHDRGYAAMAVEGATVVERVASVQQPSVTGINGNGCVAAGVTGK